MLIEGFYHIAALNSIDESLTAEIILNPDHAIYKGHFPQHAVVPGVIQIQIIKELLEADLNISMMIKEVIVAKYLRVITPLENPSLYIHIQYKPTESGEYLVNASVSKDETTFTKLKAKLSESV